MKTIYILLVIILFAGTSAQRKESAPIITQPVPISNFIDSLNISSKKIDKDADIKTDLLVTQKRKLERENIILKKEVIRLRILLSYKPDTIYLQPEVKESLFRRLFKKKKKKTIEVSNDY